MPDEVEDEIIDLIGCDRADIIRASGKTGEGVAAFMTVVPLAVITAEQWKKNGPAHWGTILSGALFSLFYIGNIYGSYVSVGIQEQVVGDEVKALVMYNLHIPLRSCFR